MKKTKRVQPIYWISIMLILISTFLTGCQSTDKSKSYLDTSELQNAEFTYDENTNQTRIAWATTLTNDTIYNFDKFSITFDLYNQNNLVKTDTFHYNLEVKHGADYTGSFRFFVDGKVDSFKYVSWKANYVSFWNTYKIWIIVTSVLACVVALIYIIVMIIKDLDLDDVFEKFVEMGLLGLLILIPPLAGIVWGIISSYWVPILIVLGGVVVFFILCLLAHLIKSKSY